MKQSKVIYDFVKPPLQQLPMLALPLLSLYRKATEWVISSEKPPDLKPTPSQSNRVCYHKSVFPVHFIRVGGGAGPGVA